MSGEEKIEQSPGDGKTEELLPQTLQALSGTFQSWLFYVWGGVLGRKPGVATIL